ncbi:MAG: tyrosine-type recombinase/integrase [Clostridia bacterium]|nr:tyrosine-type recombinase/integrase [Clostridia bacterium]
MLTETYVSHLKANTGLSDNTVNSYKYDVEGFLSYCGFDSDTGSGDEDGRGDFTEKITKDAVLSYIIHMKNSGKSLATILRCVSAIKNYGKYLSDNGIIKVNPCEGITLPRQEKKSSAKKPSSKEIDRLLSCIKKDSIKGMRDYAMICLVACCGIQASEMTELDIENFNEADSLIEVMKNGSKQFYPLSDDVNHMISKYVNKCRPLIVADNESALFVNSGGNRMTRQGFWKIIRQYKEKASIDSSVTPRTLRYSMPG